MFTMLIAFSVLKTALLYLVHLHGGAWAYFYCYWALAVVDMVLYLAVFLESAWYTFSSSDFRSRPSPTVIATLGCVGLSVALLIAWLAPLPGTGFLNPLILRGNLIASVLLSELFAGMVVFSGRAGIPWKAHPSRVLQGLGVYALSGLLIHAAQSLLGVSTTSSLYRNLSRSEIIVYAACLGYWIITLYRDAPQRVMPDKMRQELTKLSAEANRAAGVLRPTARERE